MRQGEIRRLWWGGVVALAALFPATTHAATFTVSSDEDEGVGTLRQALLDANATPGADTIAFSLPGTSIHLLAPLTPLPTITEAVVIDGTTQPGFTSRPIIELSGEEAILTSTDGLVFTASGGTVRGITLRQWGQSGIVFQGVNSGRVEGCYIGTDFTGTAIRGNTTGVLIQASQNVTMTNCLVSGGNGVGIQLEGDVTGSVISGCFIGTDSTSLLTNGNQTGVSWNEAQGGTLRNSLVTGNFADAIDIIQSSNAVIEDSGIGTNAFYDALGNGENGIVLRNSSDITLRRLSVYGSALGGIVFSGAQTQNNQLTGCDLFLNGVGAALKSGAHHNTLGGIASTEGNTFEGNVTEGIWISPTASSGNTISYNQILNNSGSGIAVYASNQLLRRNQISQNGLDGVYVGKENGFPYPTSVAIRENTFSQNDDLAIRLVGQRQTGQGANLLQPAPVLRSVIVRNNQTEVYGTLQGLPSRTYTVEFFATDSPDPSGYGEGDIYLGSLTVVTNAQGSALLYRASLPLTTLGQFVCATATDSTGNTSELGEVREVQDSLPLPTLASLVPGSVPAGTRAFVLLVSGQDFVSGATVLWNGAARPTNFVSLTQLAATIPATDVITAGSATITVRNGAGEPVSNSLVLPITAQSTGSASIRIANVTNVTRVGASLFATVHLTNSGTATAFNLRLTASLLGTVGTVTAPLPLLGNLAPGATITTTLRFPGSAGTPGQQPFLRVDGAYTGGTFRLSRRVLLP